MSSTSTNATLLVFDPNYGPSVTMALWDNPTYGPITGSGGWQVVDRPRMTAATQWYDRSPFQLVMTCVLDNEITQGSGQAGTSVENDCQTIESWLDPVPGTYLPATFTITGPVPGATNANNPKTWILFGVEFDDAIRDPQTGARTQQQMKITCYEYTSPLSANSPANKASNTITGSGTSGRTSYVIRKGDTLLSIAAKQQHSNSNSAYIAQIKSINPQVRSLADNASMSTLVGVTISLPAA